MDTRNIHPKADLARYPGVFCETTRRGRPGFSFYEPGAEVVLAKAYLALKDFEKAESNAKSAYEKVVGMKY